MIRNLLVAAGLSLAIAAPALGDGKIYVQLPDLSAIGREDAEALLSEMVLANVVSSNCPAFSVTDEEWSLLVDSADILAREHLRLSIDEYDSQFYGPAFAALNKPETCETAGPKVQPTLERLVELGGSREALPDQDAAYAAMQARQARWDAMAEAPVKVKTKNK
ncbi:MAG TPA: hypothetical protein VGB81_07285 [Devosia sp.]|jgi:hypothetical protein